MLEVLQLSLQLIRCYGVVYHDYPKKLMQHKNKSMNSDFGFGKADVCTLSLPSFRSGIVVFWYNKKVGGDPAK